MMFTVESDCVDFSFLSLFFVYFIDFSLSDSDNVHVLYKHQLRCFCDKCRCFIQYFWCDVISHILLKSCFNSSTI